MVEGDRKETEERESGGKKIRERETGLKESSSGEEKVKITRRRKKNLKGGEKEEM